MFVETDNLVTQEEFRKDLDKYVAAARQGCGPVAITRDSEIVGFFIAPEEYEALFGASVRKLLAARQKGPTVSHETARAHVQKTLKRLAGES